MSKMGDLYYQKVLLASSPKKPVATAKKEPSTAPKMASTMSKQARQIRTYYRAVKKLVDTVGIFVMHYMLSLDLDESTPSPDSIRVFREKHEGSRDVLHSRVVVAKKDAQLAFENVRFWTSQLGKPLTKKDSDGKTLLNMLCVIGQNGVWDVETARLRRERWRTIAKRQLDKSDLSIEFLSPYDLEEEFEVYLEARKKRLAKKAEKPRD